ncbi:hypothetical protein Ahia01_000705300 [Argonauta hians]
MSDDEDSPKANLSRFLNCDLWFISDYHAKSIRNKLVEKSLIHDDGDEKDVDRDSKDKLRQFKLLFPRICCLLRNPQKSEETFKIILNVPLDRCTGHELYLASKDYKSGKPDTDTVIVESGFTEKLFRVSTGGRSVPLNPAIRCETEKAIKNELFFLIPDTLHPR